MRIQAGQETLNVWSVTDGKQGVNGIMCDTVTIEAAGAPTEAQVLALVGGTILTDDGRLYEGFSGLAETTLTLFRPPETAQELEVQRLTRESEAARERVLEAERQVEQSAKETREAVRQKETAEADKAAMAGAIPALLKGHNDDALAQMLRYLPEWSEKVWDVGDVCRYDSQPYRCIQTHDATGNNSWNPKDAVSLWAVYHAKSKDYALKWARPTGAHDMYKAGEWMIFTDNLKYRCIRDTAYSPEESPQTWEKSV